MPDLMRGPEWPLLIALAVGLLIGADRERRKNEDRSHRPAGVRTFTLVAVLGGAAAAIGHGMAILAGVFVAAGALAGFVLRGQADRDLTTEVALVVTFVLGVLAHSQPLLALELGVVVAALLAYRVQIHRLVSDVLTEQELLDGLAFAIAAAVVLPMIPNRPLDAFGLFNPYTLWRLLVVVMALSGIGYVAQRLVGVRYGLLAAGLATGLISATAGVAAMAHRSRGETEMARASAAGAVASLFSSLCYLMILVFAVSPRLVPFLAPSLGAAAASMLAYAIVLGRGPKPVPSGEENPGRAFDFGVALLFVAIVGVFTALSRLLSAWLGDVGAVVGGALTGVVDAHAAGVSMATLNSSNLISDSTATLGVLVGLSLNMAIKAPIAFSLGSRGYAVRVSIGIGLILASLWLAFAAARMFLRVP